MSSTTTSSTSYKDSVRARGQLFIATVLSGDAAGDVLVDQALRPSAFPNSLFGRRSTTWERYRVHKAVVKYCPSVPTSINCNLITYHDQDVEDILTSGPEALNIALAHSGAVQHAANMPQRITCHPPKEMLWTSKGSTDRLDSFGRLVVVQRQAAVNFQGSALPAGTPLGDLVLDWDVEFAEANLEPTPVAQLMLSDVFTDPPGAIDLGADEVLVVDAFQVDDPTIGAEITYTHDGSAVSENLVTTNVLSGISTVNTIAGPLTGILFSFTNALAFDYRKFSLEF